MLSPLALVAQLVERILGRDEVCGSIPHKGFGFCQSRYLVLKGE